MFVFNVICTSFSSLLDVDDRNVVFVVIIEVLACHTPDEGIIIGTGSSVDTPFGRHDGLLVMQPYIAALLWLSHHVRDSLVGRKIEVIVCFNTATMCVRGHRVPYGTRIELCQTELQLARTFLEYVVDDELIDGAVVGLFHCSHGTPLRPSRVIHWVL